MNFFKRRKLKKDLLKKMPEKLPKGVKLKLKEQKECQHQKLKNIVNLYYQCQKCRALFYIFGSVCYRDKKMLLDELKALVENLK